jgi:putative transposase
MLTVMPDYRRFRAPGASFFFTVVTYQRRSILTEPIARSCLRAAFHGVRARHPFEVPAIVLLPDHLHAVFTLPQGDADYSLRWRRIKEDFIEQYLAGGGAEGDLSGSRRRRKERGIWQRRFWEHTIADEDDLARHVDYIHYNPVKHGLVTRAADWEFSSFHRWVLRGDYSPDWGRTEIAPVALADLDETAME